MEKTIESRLVYNGKIINLKVDSVQLPNGNTAEREIVMHPGAVCIIAVTDDGELILVRQFRKPIEEMLLELPAGKLEPGEDPKDCAARELAEETGYSAKRLEYLFSFYTSPGFSDELMHLYSASGLIAGNDNPDDDEMVEIVRMRLDQAMDMALSGQIKDAKTLVGILLLKSRPMLNLHKHVE
jgi:ADP-ribose pyrophosphatase